MEKTLHKKIVRRLLPLYIAAFLQGFVLWYGIEKLFLVGIGFNSASIAIMATAWSATMLLAETPSGILADRWSRKNVLIIAGILLAVSSLIGGLSTDIPLYIIASFFWGTFYALYSGTYDSIVYDVLLEEKNSGDDYEKYYGRVRLLDGLALVIASILGGVVGQSLGLRATYFITIPISLLSVFALMRFKEPKLHKAYEHVSIKNQIRSTFSAITKKGIIVYLLIASIFVVLIDQIIFEFNQLWLIALSTPIIIFGPASALLLSSVVFAGSLAQFFSKHRLRTATVFMATVLISSLCLALVKNIVVVAISSFLIGLILIMYQILLNKQIHDRLTSNIRAGAISAISTISRIFFIPTALAFGFFSQQSGVFNAAWILVGLVVILSVIILRTTLGLQRSALSNNANMLITPEIEPK